MFEQVSCIWKKNINTVSKIYKACSKIKPLKLELNNLDKDFRFIHQRNYNARKGSCFRLFFMNIKLEVSFFFV